MKISRAVSRGGRCQESAPPSAFPVSAGALTLSGWELILYMDHLEALRESNNNYQRAPGIAKLDLLGGLFFPSLKDPLTGQNQFQTASVALAGLTRHCLSPSPSA